VNKAQTILDETATEAPSAEEIPQYMFVKTEHRIQRVAFDEILFIEGMRDYLRIHTPEQRIMTLQNFKNMEEMLPQGQFMRVHRSYIVALDKIDSVERNLIHIGKHELRISDSYRETFFARIKQLGVG
ncbi:MAG: LytTR family DNA-binding domain-containing protein, partial [Bacteroidota bacterium]